MASSVEYIACHRNRIKVRRRNSLSRDSSNRDKKPDWRIPTATTSSPFKSPNSNVKEEETTDSVCPLAQDSKPVDVNGIYHPDRTPDTTNNLENLFFKLEKKPKPQQFTS